MVVEFGNRKMSMTAQPEEAKSVRTSRRTFIAGCVLTLVVFALAGALRWNMICNVVAALAVVNLGLSLYHSYKAEELDKTKEGQ